MSKAEKSGKGPKKKQGRSLVRPDLGGILPPNFTLAAPLAVVRQEQQTVWQDRGDVTEAEVQRQLAEAQGRALQIRRDTRVGVAGNLLLGISEVALSVSGTDPFEEFRRAQGLDTLRERLINGLFTELSVENGMRALHKTEVALMQNGLLDKKTLSADETEVFARYPNLTKTELLLFGLCESIPPMFLLGTVTRFTQANENGVLVDKQIDQPTIPLIAGASVDGLLCAPDQVNLNDKYVEDMFQAIAGITGGDGSSIVASFRPEVKKAIGELIPLMITNARLFERLWEDKARDGNALVDGFRKIQRTAAEQVIIATVEAEKVEKIREMPLSAILNSFTPEQSIQYQKVKTELEDTILAATSADVSRGVLFEAQDTVRLIGLLARIPNVYQDPTQPFEGYIMPYGMGISFMDAQGAIKEYVPYDNYYLRTFLQGMYTEGVDVSKSNKTLVQLFNMLAQQAKGVVLADLNGELSELEGKTIDASAMQFGRQTGIEFDLFPRLSLRNPHTWAEAASLEGEHFVVEPAYKFGLQELDDTLNAIKMVPPTMVEGVKRIRKLTHPATTPLQALLTGQHTGAEINTRTGTITVYQHPELSYLEYSPQMRELRAFEVTHELAHNVWRKLTPDQRTAWTEITWEGENPLGMETGDFTPYFLTTYGHSENEEEDFSDHFAAYIRHGEEFRQKALTSPWLTRKYQLLETVFEQFAGRPIQYQQVSPFTIESLTGYINAEIHRLDALNASREQAEIEAQRDGRIRRGAEETGALRSLDEVDDPIADLLQELDFPRNDETQFDTTYRTVKNLSDIFETVAEEQEINHDDGATVKKAGRLFRAIMDNDREYLRAVEREVRQVLGEDSDELLELQEIIKRELTARDYDPLHEA